MKRSPSNKRAKQAGVALLFLATFVLLIAALSYVLYPKDNSKDCGMIDAEAHGFMGEPENSLDVLFVGDSRVYAALSPLQMWHECGFTSHDLATPAQNMPYSYTMLKRAFATQKPKVVVFETDSLLMRFTVEDAAFRLLADNVPFFEYHSRWKNLRLGDFSEPVRHTWTDPLKGFQIDTVIDTKPDPIVMDALKHRMHGLAKYANYYMGLFIKLCRENGATPVMLSAPSTNATDDDHHHALQSLADRFDMDYLDLNDTPHRVEIDWSHDTSDGGEHLNYYGAVKCTHFMGSYLKEKYDLPDHRGDEAYASWDEAYANYLTMVPAQ